jgi:nucleoside diphosphate kinase
MAQKEIGLFLIKPDAVLLGERTVAVDRIKAKDLVILSEKVVVFTPELVQEFYQERQDHLSQYWEGYLTPRPSVALVIEGEDTNDKLLGIKRQLRREFGHDGFYTGTHCSDTEAEAKRQIKLLFEAKPQRS